MYPHVPKEDRETLHKDFDELNNISIQYGLALLSQDSLKKLLGWIQFGNHDDMANARQVLEAWRKKVLSAQWAQDTSGRSKSPSPLEMPEIQSKRAALAQTLPALNLEEKQVEEKAQKDEAKLKGEKKHKSKHRRQHTKVTTDFGPDILKFALKAMMEAKQIGNGECWTLANEAIKDAGASPPESRKTTSDFGKLVTTVTTNAKDEISKAKPGDILQYYNVVLTTGEGTDRHTAIVERVQGRAVYVVESNVDNVKVPQRGEVDCDKLFSGQIKVWRAVAK